MLQETDDTKVVGITTIPPPSRKPALRQLVQYRPKRGEEFAVFVNVLSDDTSDGYYGLSFFMGAFSKATEADEFVEEITLKTGLRAIRTTFAHPTPLTSNYDAEVVKRILVDPTGKVLDEYDDERFAKEQSDYERRVKIDTDIRQESLNDSDPDCIEHMKRHCYLAIVNRSRFETALNQVSEAWKDYLGNREKVLKHYQQHPDHEQLWLPQLKTRLEMRGENNLYNSIEKGYEVLRDELLGNSNPGENQITYLQQVIERQAEEIRILKGL